MFCQKCGAQQNDGVKFCGRCGAPMGGVSGFVAEPVTAASSAAPVNAPEPVYEVTPLEEDCISAFPAGRVWGRFKNIRNFLSLEGRSTRGEYWVSYLTIVMPLSLLAALLLFVSGWSGFLRSSIVALGVLFQILSYLMFFPVVARRMHDVGITAWVAFVQISLMLLSAVWGWVSIISVVPWIVFGCIPGKREANRFGESPLATVSPAANTTTEGVTWIWLSLLLLAFTHVAIIAQAHAGNWLIDLINAIERSSGRY